MTAKSKAQQFTESLQQMTQKASDLTVLTTVAENMNALNVKVQQTQQSMQQLTRATDDNTGATLNESKAQHSLHEQLALGQQAISQYHAGMVQQVQDASNVVTGAQQIARAFGITVPQAMALAQQAGVSLTGQVQNQKGQWTALGEKVRDAYAGFRAMGVASGAVGQDMLALAIQTGEAGTKMSQLNQAWDSWMSTVTGGTSDLGSLDESMQNLGLKAASSAHNLGTASSFTEKSMSDFADSLESFSGKGAQAWQNFDQVVGLYRAAADRLAAHRRDDGRGLGEADPAGRPGHGRRPRAAGGARATPRRLSCSPWRRMPGTTSRRSLSWKRRSRRPTHPWTASPGLPRRPRTGSATWPRPRRISAMS